LTLHDQDVGRALADQLAAMPEQAAQHASLPKADVARGQDVQAQNVGAVTRFAEVADVLECA
jgi:hypothetical protein